MIGRLYEKNKNCEVGIYTFLKTVSHLISSLVNNYLKLCFRGIYTMRISIFDLYIGFLKEYSPSFMKRMYTCTRCHY